MTQLPTPRPGPEAAVEFVAANLAHLVGDDVAGSPSIRGGQAAADAALDGYSVTGYARRRNEVYPASRRGASRLSPYIRHGLLTLPEVWRHVTGGPERDVDTFQQELLWQEYARHWYARLGTATAVGTKAELAAVGPGEWERDLPCLDLVVGELERDGWLVNQTRMWLASHWTIRTGGRWQDGEDHFFRHLLDGSRAANRLGWQWTTGVGSSKPYGFSRWQVEKRAPGLCADCPHRHRCPIEDWPDEPERLPVDQPAALRTDPDPEATAGPPTPVGAGLGEIVWLTAESLGRDDPALATDVDRPAVFVFDEPLLARLQLSAKRLVFLTETLAELALDRPLELHLGRPTEVLGGRPLAATVAPVPGFRRRAAQLDVVEQHPWPWLVRPFGGSVASFSAWRRGATRHMSLPR